VELDKVCPLCYFFMGLNDKIIPPFSTELYTS
jgi:hypothetical protein